MHMGVMGNVAFKHCTSNDENTKEKWEGIIMLLYRRFGKLKSTYAGNLWLPDPGAGVEEVFYLGTLFYTGTLFYPGGASVDEPV